MAWAEVRDGRVVKQIRNPKAFTMPDSGVQHPSSIFRLWSKTELKAIGIYEIEKISSSYDSRTQRKGGVTVQYDTENDRVIETESISDLPIEQIKDTFISQWKQTAFSLLQQTDWKIIRDLEGVERSAGKDVKWWREAIRTHSDTLEQGINACTTIEEIRTYLDGLENEWPKLEDYVPPAG